MGVNYGQVKIWMWFRFTFKFMREFMDISGLFMVMMLILFLFYCIKLCYFVLLSTIKIVNYLYISIHYCVNLLIISCLDWPSYCHWAQWPNYHNYKTPISSCFFYISPPQYIPCLNWKKNYFSSANQHDFKTYDIIPLFLFLTKFKIYNQNISNNSLKVQSQHCSIFLMIYSILFCICQHYCCYYFYQYCYALMMLQMYCYDCYKCMYLYDQYCRQYCNECQYSYYYLQDDRKYWIQVLLMFQVLG